MSVSHEEVVKAAQAEQILTSDVFKEAIENLKNEYITHWLNSRDIADVTAEDIRQNIVLFVKTVVRQHERREAEKLIVTTDVDAT